MNEHKTDITGITHSGTSLIFNNIISYTYLLTISRKYNIHKFTLTFDYKYSR